MRFRLGGAIALTLALLVPAGAGAAVRKVDPSGADTGDCRAAACKTIQYAADEGDGGDTVEIAAGTYNGTVETTTALHFVGAGTAATVVRGLEVFNAEGKPAFVLPNGGSIESLRAEGGDGGSTGGMFPSGADGATAIVFAPAGLDQDQLDLESVIAVGGDGGSDFLNTAGAGGAVFGEATEGGKSVSVVDSTLTPGEGGFFSGQTSAYFRGNAIDAKTFNTLIAAEGISTALLVSNGASASLDASTAQGVFAAGTEGGFLDVERSRLEGFVSAISISPEAGSTAEATVTNSVLSSVGTTARVGFASAGTVSKLTVRGSTILAENGSAAVEAGVTTESTATASLTNTIARHTPEGSNPKRDLVADGGTIDAQHSSFTTSVVENGGTAPAPGSGTNLAADPGFAAGTFGLSPSSPLIDRGDPAVVEAGEIDFQGIERSLDGNRDCVAVPDIGAYELAGQSAACPDPAPVVSGFKITNKKFAPKPSSKSRAKASKKGPRKGTKFIYRLSEPAKVAIKIERRKKTKGKARFAKATTLNAKKKAGKQSTPFSGVVRGKPLKPGKYRATIVATDSAGQASAPRRLSFKILAD